MKQTKDIIFLKGSQAGASAGESFLFMGGYIHIGIERESVTKGPIERNSGTKVWGVDRTRCSRLVKLIPSYSTL